MGGFIESSGRLVDSLGGSHVIFDGGTNANEISQHRSPARPLQVRLLPSLFVVHTRAWTTKGPVTGEVDLADAQAKWTGVDAGAAYLILGPATGTVSASTADAIFQGASATDAAGRSVSMGDTNADGYADLIIGADGVSSDLGAIYVVHGPVTGTLSPSDADASLLGAGSALTVGWSVGVLDFNGDGSDDVITGAYLDGGCGSDSGGVYLFAGPLSGSIDTTSADGWLQCEATSSFTGDSVAGGDFNGDGYDDALIGARAIDDGGTDAGAAYVVYGSTSFPGTLDLSSADARLIGEQDNDHAGESVSGAGDLDNDGRDDLLIGAHSNDSGETGQLYVLTGPVTGTLSLSTADATWPGEAAGDSAGHDVWGGGDINADGTPDVLVAAIGDDTNGSSAGAVYVLYSGGL